MKNKLKLIVCIYTLLLTLPAFAAEQVYFFHTDPAGTPLAMTDSSGSVVWKADYKPFGEENTVTSTQDNNKKFVGKEKDEETGLYYFGARYMEAKIGRFTAVDPIGAVDPLTSTTNERLLLNPQTLNLYAYGLNNPYRYVDIDGLAPEDRVAWAISQLQSKVNHGQWKYWSDWMGLPYNKCNLFVAAAHVLGDPDVYDYPTMLRNIGIRGPDSIYTKPTVADLADPLFARDRLDYLGRDDRQPGDIMVWYDKQKGVHHSAIYIGNDQIIYAHPTEGVKQWSVSEVTRYFQVEPIVRRYKYEN